MLIHGHGTGIARITAFTVLELLVTLAVATLLLVTGLPSFQQFSQRQQMKAAVNGLQHALLLARNEAVLRRWTAPTLGLLAPWHRLQLWRRRNTEAQALRNIAAHYDLGNDFYKLWLDDRMMYSSAYFEHDGASLDDASVAKIYRICRKLDLKPGMSVVEIGFYRNIVACVPFLVAIFVFGRREILGLAADHVLDRVAEPLQHCIVDVQVGAVLGNRGRHDRRLAKQPFVVVLGNHRRMIYEIS